MLNGANIPFNMKYKLKKLRGGLKVISIPMQNTDTVTVLMLIGTGSNYEERKQSGVSHYLEHMFFKGTKKYPNAGDLNKRLDAIGAQHNAFTSREETGYWVKAHKDHYPLAIGFVSDILQNALIKKEEVNKERGVIFEEMKMYFDTPRIHVWSVFERLMYGDQPAGWDIIGTKKSLSSFKRSDLVKYWNKQYVSSNSILIVAGNIKTDEVFKTADDLFKSIRKGSAKPRKKLKNFENGPKVKVLEKHTDQAHLVLGVKGYKILHKDRFVAEVLATILGGYMSSRLFMKIRERRGLAYSVSAVHQTYPESGYLAIYAGIPHKAAYKVPSYIVGEFNRIKTSGVTHEELKRAREHIKGRLAISLESTDEVASYFGMQKLLTDKILTPNQISLRIDKITRDDIKRIANKMFRPNNYYLAYISSNLDEEKLRKTMRN